MASVLLFAEGFPIIPVACGQGMYYSIDTAEDANHRHIAWSKHQQHRTSRHANAIFRGKAGGIEIHGSGKDEISSQTVVHVIKDNMGTLSTCCKDTNWLGPSNTCPFSSASLRSPPAVPRK